MFALNMVDEVRGRQLFLDADIVSGGQLQGIAVLALDKGCAEGDDLLLPTIRVGRIWLFFALWHTVILRYQHTKL